MALTKDQEKAMQVVMRGKNAFITGGGGVGKSYLIEQIIEFFRNKHKNVMVTAPTGTAAHLIKGVTCHRAFSIPFKMVWEAKPKQSKLLQKADVIIIDEVSMVRYDVFEYIHKCIELENERRKEEEPSKKPIQLIVVGDFCQLPPVLVRSSDGSPDDYTLMCDYYGVDVGSAYAFQSNAWKQCDFVVCELAEVVRQSDKAFVEALTQIRFGDSTGINFVMQRQKKKAHSGGSGATSIAGKNKTVENINKTEISKLKGDSRIYEADVIGTVTKDDKPTPDTLELKIGTQVILLINTEKYHNGSVGTITDMRRDAVEVELAETEETVIVPKNEWEVTRYVVTDDGEIRTERIGVYRQLPLKPGYAVTVHKSQGQTYDKVELVVGQDGRKKGSGHPEIFCCGQLYVALSRVKSVDSLHIQGDLTKVNLLADDKVLEYYRSIGICSKEKIRLNESVDENEKRVYEELKDDLRGVIEKPETILEVAKKHNLTWKNRGREYVKASVVNAITLIKQVESEDNSKPARCMSKAEERSKKMQDILAKMQKMI